MTRPAAYAALLILIAGAALGLRLPHLEQRPCHGDEAVHAWKCNELWTTGRYVYDPHEYHGPTLYYLTLPVLWLRGVRDWTGTTLADYRIVTVIAGVALIPLLALLGSGLGRRAVLAAAALAAVSPAGVYYSRHYIQETLLATGTLVLLAGGWHYVRTRRTGWAVLAGAAAGWLLATKETAVLVFASAALAAGATWLLERSARRATPTASTPRAGAPATRGNAALALLLAVIAATAVAALAFSVLGTHPAGVLDACRAWTHYFERAGDTTHVHPWYYYLQLLTWTHYRPAPVFTEALIVALAVVGIIAMLRSRPAASGNSCAGAADPRLLRFIALYTLMLGAVYAAIPYKTPWCVLGLLQGLILCAGVGVPTLFAAVRARLARVRVVGELLACVLLVGVGHLAWQAWQAATRWSADHRNPYAYAQPVPDVVQASAWVEQLADASPAGRRLLVKVIAPNPWPLPWYLRRLERVGYWETPPADADAPVIVTTPDFWTQLRPSLHGSYRASFYGLRPSEPVVVAVDEFTYAAFARRARETASRAVSSPAPSGSAP